MRHQRGDVYPSFLRKRYTLTMAPPAFIPRDRERVASARLVLKPSMPEQRGSQLCAALLISNETDKSMSYRTITRDYYHPGDHKVITREEYCLARVRDGSHKRLRAYTCKVAEKQTPYARSVISVRVTGSDYSQVAGGWPLLLRDVRPIRNIRRDDYSAIKLSDSRLSLFLVSLNHRYR